MTWLLESVMLLGRKGLACSFQECLTAAARVHSVIIMKRVLSFLDEAISTVPSD